MRCVVTGAAGFIASNLVDRLLSDGHQVIGYDNFSTGVRSNLEGALSSNAFELVEADLLDADRLRSAVRGAEKIFHFAANADVRFGLNHPKKDLEQNVYVTWNVLEAMRQENVPHIIFSSTGSVYGEATVIPTPEDAPFPIQTSLYGASKASAEAFIQAYAEGFGIRGTILRFVSVLGERYSHGHVIDFYKQLKEHPDRIRVLGDGSQRKSYLYIGDCIDAVISTSQRECATVEIFNLGTDEYCTVNDSLHWICAALNVEPRIEYSGGNRGWVGDNPFIFLDCSKLKRECAWHAKVSIQQAVQKTVSYLCREI